MSTQGTDTIRPIEWVEGTLRLIDQRLLPQRVEWLTLRDVGAVTRAIREMTVRGAPAIGIAAAYGCVLAARDRWQRSPASWKAEVAADVAALRSARPTAVNLAWALERMLALIARVQGDPEPELLAEAKRIHDEDIAANHRMGRLGAGLIERPCAMLTHCNAGALATGGFGTALGVVRTAFDQGKLAQLYATETRPWLQGARLTAWELTQDGIPVRLIADHAAAYLMQQRAIEWIIVGADRIVANGDVVNKIGTYALAVAARHHEIPLMVVAPTSTIDLSLADGNAVPIETRAGNELASLGRHRVAAAGVATWNPVFDVTPARFVTALVTERGVVRPPNVDTLAALLNPVGANADGGC